MSKHLIIIKPIIKSTKIITIQIFFYHIPNQTHFSPSTNGIFKLKWTNFFSIQKSNYKNSNCNKYINLKPLGYQQKNPPIISLQYSNKNCGKLTGSYYLWARCCPPCHGSNGLPIQIINLESKITTQCHP